MSQTLIIKLPSTPCDPDTAVEWMLVDSDNQPFDEGCTAISELYDGLSSGEDFQVCVVIPAEYVLSLRVQVPTSQLRQIRQALPYIVEELVADDIENIHTAIPASFRAALPDIDTLVVEHSLLIKWLDLLCSHQLKPSAILVDALCLPREPDSWSIYVEGERVLLRTANNRCLALQPDDFEMVITAMLRKEQQLRSDSSVQVAVPQLQVMASQQFKGSADAVKNIAGQLKKRYPDYPIKATLFKQDPLQLLSFDWQEQQASGINLLQGGYATSQAATVTGGQWNLVAAVAVLGISVFLLLAVVSGWIFNQRADQLERRSMAMYRELFPEQRRVVNPRRQMQNQLKQRGGQNNHSFLALLAETAQSIQGEPQSADVSLRQIRFNSDQGNLRFEVNSKSLDQLDRFKNLLAGTGLQVDINSASEQDGSVLGRIVVSQP